MYVCMYIYIDKTRLSNKKLYNKEHNSFKYYLFYEHDDEYIPQKIVLKDVVGYYNDHKHNGMKVEMKNMLKQLYMMKHALEKRKVKKLIQFQIKKLSINVEYYYKNNLFTII